MEAEERPAKLRKLNSNDDMGSPEDAGTPLLSKLHGMVTGSVDALSLQNSKLEGCAANNEDHSVTREEEDLQDESDGVELDPDTEHHLLHKVPLQHQQQDDDGSKPLSKNQLKKLRKREEWEAARDYRKAKRKQKTQERKARKRAAREEEEQHRLQLLLQQPSLVEGENGDVQRTKTDTPHLPSKIKFRRPVQVPMTIIIDCGFDDLMMEKERISLGSQLTRSYSDNSRSRYQTNLVISSWGGLLKERFDTVLSKHYLNWRNVTFEDGDFVAAAKKAEEFMKRPHGGKLVACFEKYAHGTTAGAGGLGPARGEACEDLKDAEAPRAEGVGKPDTGDPLMAQDTSAPKNPESAQPEAHRSSSPSDPTLSQGEIIYLTSDSPDTLDTLSPYSTYIVGGLVDKNRHKGICYKTATSRGVKTAKLPIGEYLEMTSRKVLATNHVVEILLRYLEEEDWGKAFLRVIPKRKGGKLREEAGAVEGEKNGKSEGDEEEQGEDEDDVDGNDADDGSGNDDVSSEHQGDTT
ncbi:uncharacterized protein A1O5_03259 [Cladophialophora psammophila CBS 110553]|uniref:tRNA (guanine(9)-N1)-methyltransferase n=1 Tax=Cladophialophora psammophila CBS 110553 TaxID=1182543 RepID=W9WZY7_9EURO|nr:uncharacterized protein A1O5_03259 [Cladophialophora psammophila CBS 110553]EXJ73498.1 hypothetical protein A1O5_03259 [Cladophialophora psammophila CBS 110553]